MKNHKTMRKYGRSIRKKTRKYKGGEGGEEDDICSICQIGFNQQDETYIHPICKNKFHMKCIKQWYAVQHTCPICRGTDIELPLNEYDLLYNKYMTLETKCKEIDDDYTYLDNEYTKLEDECNEAKEELVTALEAAHKHYKKLSTDYNKLIDTTNITQKKYDALQIKYGELVKKDEGFEKLKMKNTKLEEDISYLIEENDNLNYKHQNSASKFSR